MLEVEKLSRCQGLGMHVLQRLDRRHEECAWLTDRDRVGVLVGWKQLPLVSPWFNDIVRLS